MRPDEKLEADVRTAGYHRQLANFPEYSQFADQLRDDSNKEPDENYEIEIVMKYI